MTKRVLLPVFTAAVLAGAFWIAGCSKDDTPTNNNTLTGPKIYIQLVVNSQFTYNRTVLDSANQPVAGTTHPYQVELKKGNMIVGAFSDWFFRIGTDGVTLEKDTLLIRTNTGSVGGTSFTREVQVYGMDTVINRKLVEMILASIPGATLLTQLTGPHWDPVAMYHNDTDGKAWAVGKDWQIGDATTLNFNYLTMQIPVSVSKKGKLEAIEEAITVGSKTVKAWKTSITTTVVIPIVGTMTQKMYLWFSDDPDGQIKMEAQSTTLKVLTSTVNVPGEVQELKSYLIP
jgi:hypothetical protein